MLADTHPRSLRSLTPLKGGKKGALTDLVVGQVAHFNLTPESLPLYVDGLICYHSCCQVQLKGLTARVVANQTINTKGFWRQVEMHFTHTGPHPRSLRSLTPSKRGKRALTDLVVGQVAHFNLTPEASLC